MKYIYRASLKTRKQMERDMPRHDLGWWYDVCPGKTLVLREATEADLARCNMREGTSKDPADYLCENIASGSLVNRKAIAKLTIIGEAPPTQSELAELRLAARRYNALATRHAYLMVRRLIGEDGYSSTTARAKIDAFADAAAAEVDEWNAMSDTDQQAWREAQVARLENSATSSRSNPQNPAA